MALPSAVRGRLRNVAGRVTPASPSVGKVVEVHAEEEDGGPQEGDGPKSEGDDIDAEGMGGGPFANSARRLEGGAE